MKVHNNNMFLQEIQKNNSVNNNQNSSTPSKKTGLSFDSYMKETLESKELQFSKHASTRLNSRDINLSNEQLQRVEGGISKARQKGINDSLVIVDNIALVVNIRNKVVVTALDKSQDDSIFTNIDGAVIV